MAGLEGLPWALARSLPPGPVPGEPGFASTSILTLGTLSNCTKVAVCQSYPTPGAGVSASSPFSPTPPLLLSRTISLFLCIPG